MTADPGHNHSTVRLSTTLRVLYGVGEVANAVRAVLFGLFLLYFYTTVMGLPGTLVGVAAGIGLVWDGIIDPYIGHVSDRARSRLGRRHVFMLVGGATVGLGFWALFSPPRGLPTEALFAWLLLMTLGVRLAGSLFSVPYYALGAELSDDYQERTLLTGIRGAFGLCGSLAAASLPFVVFFPTVVAGQDPKLNYGGYQAMGLAAGLVLALAALTATIATLPRRQPRDSTSSPSPARAAGGLARASLSALANRSFRALTVSFTLVFLSITLASVLLLYFLTYYVEIVDSSTVSLLQLALYSASLVGIPIWLGVARIVEKRSMYLGATTVLAVVMVAEYLLLGSGHWFGTGDVRPVLVGQVIAGLAVSVFWILPASMIADVSDEDALATGQRRSGVLFGIFSLTQQVATGLAALLAGVLLDWFAGLVPGQLLQSALTVERVAMLFSLLPAALLLAGAYLIWPYRLDRHRVATVQATLARAPAPSASTGMD